jgi:hypothetical protein
VGASVQGTLRTDAPDQVTWLLEAIGPRFTAAGVGVSDARTLRRWRDGSTEPRDHAERDRLQLLFRIAYVISLVYGGRASVAASFRRSANPQLDDQSPLVLLATSDQVEVERLLLSAVRAFLEG